MVWLCCCVGGDGLAVKKGGLLKRAFYIFKIIVDTILKL